jgi:hypothetical protein
MEQSRRSLLCLAAGGGAALAVGAAEQPKERLLTAADHFDIGDRGPQMVAKAQALAREYIGKQKNCAQATIAALQDAIEFVPKDDTLFLAGTCLHGGATASHNANCGAFTGAAIVIGGLCGRTRAKAGDPAEMALATKLIREISGRWDQAYGCVICKDVRAKVSEKCAELVGQTAGWAAETLLKQFAGPPPAA